MSRIPPESLFRRCKLCGADFSTSRSPKASMARHLRFRHKEEFAAYSKVTDGYMAEVILKNKIPTCANPKCKAKVRLHGFEFLPRYCSPRCSSAHQHLLGGAFSDPAKVSARNKEIWQRPDYRDRMREIHSTPEAKERKSRSARKYWSKPGVKEARSERHKKWWRTKFKDTEYMKMRSEVSSRNASHLLKHNPNFGYSKALKGGKYRGVLMRSSWEIALAKKLTELGFRYKYEPETFKLDNGIRYTPDFYLPEVDIYLEVKPRKFSAGRPTQKLRALRSKFGKRIKFIDLDGIKALTFEKLFDLVRPCSVKLTPIPLNLF